MPSAGFEPATPSTKRPQTYALDRTVTEVGPSPFFTILILKPRSVSMLRSRNLLILEQAVPSNI
jgi:hypothetical protein